METKLAELGTDYRVDPAGNAWATIEGEDSSHALLVGGHIDSVPNGGWLDGCLNLLAGLEILRALHERGRPPISVSLVDWADEEGARFGRGLVGSSAASATLDVEELGSLSDRDGRGMRAVLEAHGVKLEKMLEAQTGLEGAVAYLELHIEQGPILEQLGLAMAAVTGTIGVERHIVHFRGKALHAGSTPMDARQDPLAAASRLILAVREQARDAAGLVTVGSCVTEPGIATATAELATLLVDQRHQDKEVLGRLLAEARITSARIAEEESVEVDWSDLWRIDPVQFDADLIDLVDDAIESVTGTAQRISSGPLHDAAEVARAGVPAVMLFVRSIGGISHNKDEDSHPEDLELSVLALAESIDRVLAGSTG